MGRCRRTILSTAVLGLFALGAGPARAATVWLCGLSAEGTRLVCVADADPLADRQADPLANPPPNAAADGAAAATPRAVVNGTAFPLDPAQRYTVDLWSPPTEAAFVQQLAQASLCHRSPGCSVLLAPSPWLADARAPARPQAALARR